MDPSNEHLPAHSPWSDWFACEPLAKPDRRGAIGSCFAASSGRSGFCLGRSFAGVFFGSLGVDVGPHCFQGHTADTANEVSAVPEQLFLVEHCDVFD